MRSFDPGQLETWTKGAWLEGRRPATISGFHFDARQLPEGACFIALTSGARDGHAFAAQAKEAGAAALMVEREVEVDLPQLIVADTLEAMGAMGGALRQQFNGPVLGVTGSSGKTSTKEMLGHLLSIHQTHTTKGNWNNRIGVPMTLFDLEPESHGFAVVEAGINQPGEMSALGAMIQADLCVVTHIGPAHLELLGSLDGVAAEKSQLFEYAADGARLVLTAPTLAYSSFSRFRQQAIVLLEAGASPSIFAKDLVPYSIDSVSAGQSEITVAGESYSVATTSRGIATNAALAVTTARELGIDVATIRSRLAQWQPAKDRGEWIHAGDRSFYVDCYNANPASMADAIEAFMAASESDRPRCYVMGAMNELGEHAITLHRDCGEKLELRGEDSAWFVGPSELVVAYAEGAQASGATADQLHMADDVESAQSEIAEFSGAFFLKGSRSYQLEQLVPRPD